MKAKELECMNKLIHEDMYEDFKEYLIDNKLAKEEDFKLLSRDFERARFIGQILDDAAKDGRLQLVDYEWSFLPLELITVTCVSETEKREFKYGH